MEILMEEILHQLIGSFFPIIYKVLAPSQVVSRISEPSTVCIDEFDLISRGVQVV